MMRLLIFLTALALTTPPAQPPTGTAGRAPTPEEIAAAKRMPDGAARDLTVRVCGQCHEPERSAALRLSRDGWAEEVAKMIALGAQATPDEVTRIVDYLAEHYKGEAARATDMNSATAVELESVAGLLKKEAAAWIAYRTKNGPCKTLDDLKKVAGVPFKKIDARRDRLVCL